MTNTYTADSLASARISDSSPMRHVFVVGMPRSGVALAGQILAAHWHWMRGACNGPCTLIP
jgi:hypothetical protein